MWAIARMISDPSPTDARMSGSTQYLGTLLKSLSDHSS
jgi:hypothetical protein